MQRGVPCQTSRHARLIRQAGGCCRWGKEAVSGGGTRSGSLPSCRPSWARRASAAAAAPAQGAAGPVPELLQCPDRRHLDAAQRAGSHGEDQHSRGRPWRERGRSVGYARAAARGSAGIVDGGGLADAAAAPTSRGHHDRARRGPACCCGAHVGASAGQGPSLPANDGAGRGRWWGA